MAKWLKLTKLSKEEMGKVVGGLSTLTTESCYCACRYANQGGSTTIQNATANHGGGLSSPKNKS